MPTEASEVRLVTGAAGFLGRQLLLELGDRHPAATILAVVRGGVEDELRAWLTERRGRTERLEVVVGDVTQERCGLDARTVARLAATKTYVYHCAARYDLERPDPELDAQVNVDGTRTVLRLAEEVGAAGFSLMSSVAVAGTYHGVWTEEHLHETHAWRSSYASSKHRAEVLVHESTLPSRSVFRLGVLVGDELTGTYFKPDGVYSFFGAIRKIHEAVPLGVPLPTIGWGAIPLCPVDHAARAVVALAAAPDDGLTVHHVFEDEVLRAGDIMRLVLEAAGRPRSAEVSWLGHLVQGFNERAEHDGVLTQLKNDAIDILHDVGVPRYLVGELNQPTQFSNAATSARLAALGIGSPAFEQYASRTWHGWLAHEARAPGRRELEFFRGKHVVMTGGSSGVGAGILRRLLEHGVASVVVLGRNRKRLDDVLEYQPGAERVELVDCDLLDDASVGAAIDRLAQAGREVDLLVLSAGLSIDRPLRDMSADLEELSRMTQVNFVAPMRLVRALVPLMADRPDARVVTLSSIATQLDVPGFSMYSATKAALDQAFAVLPSELTGSGVSFVSVRLPLVKTPMTNVNIRLRNVPMLSVGAAVDMVVAATVSGRRSAGGAVGRSFEVLKLWHPVLASVVGNLGWKGYVRVPYFSRVVEAYLGTGRR
ncbi:SDR family NAD(P)-dependent oxidoreductase [Isoptericola sp. G70]|uniref:SDR family NAD(P)-dependent oxidoreductase n=1 Tax=Isoptericola sp. G70 TaxID=3376633 RepID=UPI003A80198E